MQSDEPIGGWWEGLRSTFLVSMRAPVRVFVGYSSRDRRGEPVIGQEGQKACQRWRRAFASVTQLQQLLAAGWGSLLYSQITLCPTTQHYTNFTQTWNWNTHGRLMYNRECGR